MSHNSLKEHCNEDIAQAADKPMMENESREDRIRAAAYRRYLARSENEADEMIDWLAAEAEVDAEDRMSD